MTDVSNLDDLANAISKGSPKIRAYAQAQAAATQSQELDIRAALAQSGWSGVLHPEDFGVTQDGSTDDWLAWQRLILSASGQRIEGAGVAFGKTSVLSQPLVLVTERMLKHVTFQTRSDYSPVDPNGALVMLANRSGAFTALASSDTFAVDTGLVGGFDQTNHTAVVFNTPYGDTLPSPLISGRVYYINTVPTPTSFTVSATKGGPLLDITADGSGQGYFAVYELSRVYWDYVRLNLTVPGVNGALLNLQQPAAIKNLRIEMDAAGSSYPAATGLRIGGQIGYVENAEINSAANCRGVLVEGHGITIRNFNDHGAGVNDVAIEVQGNSVGLDTLWTEAVGQAGVLVSGTARGLGITGTWLHSGSAPAFKSTAADTTSYSILASFYTSSQSQGQAIFDLDGKQLFAQDAGIPSGDQVADYHGAFRGLLKSEFQGPVFLERTQSNVTANYVVRRVDQFVISDATAGSFTVTLPSSIGYRGSRHTIKRKNAGANIVTVGTTGSQTIDGATTYPLAAQYQYVTVESDGANWLVVANN